MTLEDLQAAHRLYLIDKALAELKMEAQALDVGKEQAARARELIAKRDAAKERAAKMHGDIKDMELQQKSLEDKAAREHKRLFGGEVVNPKEVAALEADIAATRERASALDEPMFELMEEHPAAEAEFKSLQEQVSQAKSSLNEVQEAAKEQHQELKGRYAIRKAERKEAAAAVPTRLLGEYEAIRKRYGDVGMAEVLLGGECSECHVTISRRSQEMAALGKIVTCEGCARILFPEAHGGLNVD